MHDKPGPDGTWPLAVIDGREAGPCVGSGHCCKQAPCHLALERGVTKGPCTFLEEEGGRHWCGLIRSASPEEAARFRAQLYVGAGCCSPLNSSRLKMLSNS